MARVVSGAASCNAALEPVAIYLDRKKVDITCLELVRCSSSALLSFLPQQRASDHRSLATDMYKHQALYIDRARVKQVLHTDPITCLATIIVEDCDRNFFYKVGGCYLPSPCTNTQYAMVIESRRADLLYSPRGPSSSYDVGHGVSERTLEEALEEAPRLNLRGHAIYVLPSSIPPIPVSLHTLAKIWKQHECDGYWQFEELLRRNGPVSGFTSLQQVHDAVVTRGGYFAEKIAALFPGCFVNSLRYMLCRYWRPDRIAAVHDERELISYWSTIKTNPSDALFNEHAILGRLDAVSFGQLVADLCYEASQISRSLSTALEPPRRMLLEQYAKASFSTCSTEEIYQMARLVEKNADAMGIVKLKQYRSWLRFIRKLKPAAWTRIDLTINSSLLTEGVCEEEEEEEENEEVPAPPPKPKPKPQPPADPTVKRGRGRPRKNPEDKKVKPKKKPKKQPKNTDPAAAAVAAAAGPKKGWGIPPEVVVAIILGRDSLVQKVSLGERLNSALELFMESKDKLQTLADSYARIVCAYIRCGITRLQMKFQPELGSLSMENLKLIQLKETQASEVQSPGHLIHSGSSVDGMRWVKDSDESDIVLVIPSDLICKVETEIARLLHSLQDRFSVEKEANTTDALRYKSHREWLINTKRFIAAGVRFEADESDFFNGTPGKSVKEVDAPIPRALTLDTLEDILSFDFKERLLAMEESDALTYFEKELCNAAVVVVDYPQQKQVAFNPQADILARFGKAFDIILNVQDVEEEPSLIARKALSADHMKYIARNGLWACFVGVERWTPDEFRRALALISHPDGNRSRTFGGACHLLVLTDLFAHDLGCHKYFAQQEFIKVDTFYRSSNFTNPQKLLDTLVKESSRPGLLTGMSVFTGTLADLPRFRLNGVPFSRVDITKVKNWKDIYTFLSYTTRQIHISQLDDIEDFKELVQMDKFEVPQGDLWESTNVVTF